ncbi:hypothetical protein B5E52_11070 [Bacteroides xylanisolvens]|jgi:hypothetical protein|uniref:Uncharacterized protein n=1 Tax=Bacteroides xylanisolvens TaxID=371601 RepID=A0A1Y4VDY5_9BACE|nr:hypothetical protein B5E52_11070 [Bacteroides xylanisolvens]
MNKHKKLPIGLNSIGSFFYVLFLPKKNKSFSSSFSSSKEEVFLFISLFIMGDEFFCIFYVFSVNFSVYFTDLNVKITHNKLTIGLL